MEKTQNLDKNPKKLEEKAKNLGGRPHNSKDTYKRTRRSNAELTEAQELFKGTAVNEFAPEDVSKIINKAKVMAMDGDRGMIQFLLAKMWESDKAKEVNVNLSGDNLRDILDESLDDLENDNTDGEDDSDDEKDGE